MRVRLWTLTRGELHRQLACTTSPCRDQICALRLQPLYTTQTGTAWGACWRRAVHRPCTLYMCVARVRQRLSAHLRAHCHWRALQTRVSSLRRPRRATTRERALTYARLTVEAGARTVLHGYMCHDVWRAVSPRCQLEPVKPPPNLRSKDQTGSIQLRLCLYMGPTTTLIY